MDSSASAPLRPPASSTVSVSPKTAWGDFVASPTRPRLDAIDLLRGFVMIVMVLDHTRDFLGQSAQNPRDVMDSALFLTRWVTHFCAPIFVFLAGISAFLYGSRGRSSAELSRFLLTRGVWLVVLELTVVKLGWTMSVAPHFFVLQVIWAIGCAMIALAALVFLPRWAIATFSIVVIGGHNLLDGIKAETLGGAGWIWSVLHAPALLQPFEGTQVLALYSVLPWTAVLAAGFAFGPTMLLPPAVRKKRALTLGTIAVALFIVLRATGVYGEPAARVSYDGFIPTLLSFLNCEKYPPSLLYLTMTLGPALLVLGLVGEVRTPLAAKVITFGRVPMFYYVAHIFVLHALAIVYSLYAVGDATWLIGGIGPRGKPPGFGLSLPLVYAAWIAVVGALYPASRWFAALKQRRRDWWVSYL